MVSGLIEHFLQCLCSEGRFNYRNLYKYHLVCKGNPVIKIRRSHDRLIFIMWFSLPIKTFFYIFKRAYGQMSQPTGQSVSCMTENGGRLEQQYHGQWPVGPEHLHLAHVQAWDREQWWRMAEPLWKRSQCEGVCDLHCLLYGIRKLGKHTRHWSILH